MFRVFNVKMDSNICNNPAIRGSIYFFMLIALVMISLNPCVIILPALLYSAVIFVTDTFIGATVYTATVLTVCKNE